MTRQSAFTIEDDVLVVHRGNIGRGRSFYTAILDSVFPGYAAEEAEREAKLRRQYRDDDSEQRLGIQKTRSDA